MLLALSNIPQELISQNLREGDVSILIGKNGSGKSYMLGILANQYLSHGKKIIAISNSIHDKFPNDSRKFHLLRDRAGRKKVKRSIKNALLNIPDDEITRLKHVSQALDFIGYDPVIGIEVPPLYPSYFESNHYTPAEWENAYAENWDELKALALKLERYKSGSIVWLSMNEFSFSEVDKASLLKLLKWEPELRRLKVLNNINIYLSKNGTKISLYEASSGELSFISSIVYLAATIDDNSAILIDEPENSLHPSWQKDYIKTLLQLFYLYQPKIVIATHSALVVTGAEVANPDTIVFECRNFQFYKKGFEPINIEEAFYDYFNVITPQNRFLSDLLVSQLNKLAAGEITYDELMLQLDELETDSYDPKQREVLNGTRVIAERIINSNNSAHGQGI